MNVPDTAVQGSVRFSLSRYNTEADVDGIIEAFPEMVANVRRHLALLGPREERAAG